ncbi:SigE family RNA polymerase sigma factor [Stackebrandtia albiflava]|nr:SigE family RNA polymerase sigma factor [Stackebrandtia albiflava]
MTSQARTATAGRRAEFSAFVSAHSPSLLRAAFLLTGDQHLAEDLVQDALARTYRAWNRLDRAGNAAAYTRKVMYHLQVSWWRRRKVAETLTDAVPHRAARGRDVALEVTMHHALLKLTPAQRAAIVLRFFEDRTEVETARILGCSQSTVKTRTRRGLEKLRGLAPELEGMLS